MYILFCEFYVFRFQVIIFIFPYCVLILFSVLYLDFELYLFMYSTLKCFFFNQIRWASVVEWLELLTYNHLPLTAVCSVPLGTLDTFIWGSYPACSEGHLRSFSTSKAGKSTYSLYCVGATSNPTKRKNPNKILMGSKNTCQIC